MIHERAWLKADIFSVQVIYPFQKQSSIITYGQAHNDYLRCID